MVTQQRVYSGTYLEDEHRLEEIEPPTWKEVITAFEKLLQITNRLKKTGSQLNSLNLDVIDWLY